MDSRFLRRAVVVAALAVAVGLSGCGRKGALEAPPGAAIKPAPSTDTSAPTDGTPKTTSNGKPDKAFLLDPLLQ